jgi:itaconyl-CoA hydratase
VGWDEVRLMHPVFAGDTICAESEVLSKRESKSRPHARIVTVHTRGVNQDGRVVLRYKRTVMIYRCDHAPHTDLFLEIQEG